MSGSRSYNYASNQYEDWYYEGDKLVVSPAQMELPLIKPEIPPPDPGLTAIEIDKLLSM